MELQQEELKAGYNYVRVVRALGYAILAGGSAASVVLLALGIGTAVPARFAHSQQREELRAEIVELTEAQQKAIAEAAEQEKANQSAAVKNYTELHAQYDKALKVAVTEVGKLFAQAAQKADNLHVGDIPGSSQAAVETGKTLETVMSQSGDFKILIYRQIQEGYQKLLEPLVADYKSKEGQIKSLESQIENKRQEIIRIKSTQKDGSVRVVVVGKHVVPIDNVYNAQTDSDVAPYQKIALSVLPLGARSLPAAEDNATVAAEVKNLKRSITSLQSWLPYMEDGEEKLEREDAVALTSQQKARISELMMEIEELNEKVEGLRQAMAPLASQIKQLNQSRDLVVNQTAERLAGVWHIDVLLKEMQAAAAALAEAYADAEQHRLQEAARKLYDEKIAGKEDAIADSHAQDAAASNAVLLTNGGAGISALALAWLIWGLLLVHADSFVSRLVVASRLQFDKGLRHDAE